MSSWLYSNRLFPGHVWSQSITRGFNGKEMEPLQGFGCELGIWLGFVSSVSRGEEGWKSLFEENIKEKKSKKSAYRRKLGEEEPKGGCLAAGGGAHNPGCLSYSLAEWQPSLNVETINRNVQSGRGNFGAAAAAAMSSWLRVLPPKLYKPVVKKSGVSSNLFRWPLLSLSAAGLGLLFAPASDITVPSGTETRRKSPFLLEWSPVTSEGLQAARTFGNLYFFSCLWSGGLILVRQRWKVM